MNILALVHRYGPDRCAGAEVHLHDLLVALVERGHRVAALLSDQYGDPYTHDGVEVYPTNDLQRQTMAMVPAAHVLITHLENTPRAAYLGKLNDKPVVAVHHNTFAPSKEALLGPGRVDLVAANSSWVSRDLTGWVNRRGAHPVKTVIVRPIPDRAAFRTPIGDRVTLVNCRRYDPDDNSNGEITKGGELLRQVAWRLPEIKFLGVHGTYGTQETFDGVPNVEVVGPVAHHRMVPEVYNRTRLLIVPSNYESWGRAAAEAMAAGIPVVATPTEGLTECLGDAGLYAQSDDPEEWARLIRHALGPRYWQVLHEAVTKRSHKLQARRYIERERWVRAVEQISETPL